MIGHAYAARFDLAAINDQRGVTVPVVPGGRPLPTAVVGFPGPHYPRHRLHGPDVTG